MGYTNYKHQHIQSTYQALDALSDQELYKYHAHLLEQLLKISNIKYNNVSEIITKDRVSVPTCINEYGIVMSVQGAHGDRCALSCLSEDGDAFVCLLVDGYYYNVYVKVDNQSVPNVTEISDPTQFGDISRGAFTRHQKRSKEISEMFWGLSDSEKFEYSSKLLTQIVTLLGLTPETPKMRDITKILNFGRPSEKQRLQVSTFDEHGRLHALKEPACLFFTIVDCNYAILVWLAYRTKSHFDFGYNLRIDIDDSPLPNIVGIHDIERYLEMLKV